MDFDKVMNGIIKFLDKEILPDMNMWQDFTARIAIARIINNSNKIKSVILDNPFLKTFAIADEKGNIDVDGLINDIKTAMRDKGKLEFNIPMFGKFSFTESDADTLHSYIVGV